MKTFHFYPTLLNEFHRFNADQSDERKEILLKRINRIPETDPAILAKFKRGISFESAVLKNKPSNFPQKLIIEARNQLPVSFQSQKYIEFVHEDIRFYGYADVVGEGKVIDLKSTAVHRAGRHDFNFQNLYLYALQPYGFHTMEYQICDGEKLYVEQYNAATYDFDILLSEMKEFKLFLLKNETLITDKKIIQYREPDLFG